MASSKFVLLATLAIVLPALAMATEYVVGDADGWKVGPNYTQWASGKAFYVGDTLVFKYQAPHNVFKVDGVGFKDCTPSANGLTSGNDTITLAAPGKKWYICGYSNHCSQGQKLVINVMSNGPAPAPASPNGSYRLTVISSYYKIVVAAFLLLGFIAI